MRCHYFYTGLSKWSRECTYVQVFTEIVHAVGTINTAVNAGLWESVVFLRRYISRSPEVKKHQDQACYP